MIGFDGETLMNTSSTALAEGLYWYAEKLLWGYEGVEKDHTEAFKLFRQAADLGFSDAHLRVGLLHEYGKGTERDTSAALVSYRTAVEAGNFFGFALLAKLMSRGSQNARAQALWDRFIAELEANPEPGFLAATPGELLHEYIAAHLRLGLDPQHAATLRRYRVAIIGYHQQLLEHTNADDELDRLEIVSKWMHQHLGPWP
jgi:TPR repeat protein